MARMTTGGAFRMRGRRSRGNVVRGWQGKPTHPPLTDIPVGAYVIAPVLDAIAFFGGTRGWAEDLHKAAGYVLLAGAAFSILTVTTGFADWLAMRAGSGIRRLTNSHMWAMIVVTGLVLANLGLRYIRDIEPRTDGLLFGLSIGIFVMVAAGSAIGGSLVYDHGYAVDGRGLDAGGEQAREAV